ncbi:spore germination protein [Paenibacillus guangzhouensis]|uniref:spore germination protein n=1 Tax=Paenibacillus guangzhouensis TaxID=1473112 RepID=UPI001D115306|nr:spore germination protein [Paenibacillus guangzhouensis]
MSETSTLEQRLKHMAQSFGESPELVVRRISIGSQHEIGVGLLYLSPIVDDEKIFRIHYALENRGKIVSKMDVDTFNGAEIPPWAISLGIPSGDIQAAPSEDKLITAILNGNTVLLFENARNGGLIVSTSGGEHRQVSEPTTQTTIRGAKEGFTETLQTNIALIRRRIKSEDLWTEAYVIGTLSKTDVHVMYIKSKVSEDILAELRSRLKNIKIEAILESNYIEESIQDSTFGIFPTVNNTERPDVAAAALLAGRIVILVDGTPFVLIIPALLTHFFQSPEDYYHRYDFGLTRILRYISYLITLLTPGLYIALTTYHQEMLPTTLLISIASQREGIPFPAFIEATIMELTFLLLYEAGIRLPRAVGSAISIVGALVLGQAAVEANLISAGMVIIVSITAITSQIFPNVELGISIRYMRFAMMAVAAVFGLVGMFIGCILIILHIAHLKSFGVSFSKPIAPFNWRAQRDNFIRVPWRLRDWKRMEMEHKYTGDTNASTNKSE